MRIVLIGAVGSSLRTLEGLLRHGIQVVGVLGLARPGEGEVVSGWVDLEPVCRQNGVPFQSYRKINTAEVEAIVREWRPDMLFVIGMSQLVGSSLVSLARHGGVGFHPTALPKGRGRAPLAWITLNGDPASATFFRLEDTADSGDIFVQERVDVPKGSYASDVGHLIHAAIDRALDRWLPKLKAGDISAEAQDPSAASWYGKRTPDDGLIDWHQSATAIHALIRASSEPHPGAFTHLYGKTFRKLIIWQATISTEPFTGTVGHVLDICPAKGALVQCGSGLLRLSHTEFPDHPDFRPLRTGDQLGLKPELELVRMKEYITQLEARITALEGKKG